METRRLTYRDLSVLSYLREQGVATAEQLTRRFFPSYESFRSRISKLTRNGHTEGISLRDYLNEVPSKFRDFSKLLRCSPDIRYKMSLYRLGHVYKAAKVHGDEITTPMFWQHQIYLNDIRSFLEKTLVGDGFIVTDPEIRREWVRFKNGTEEPIPDLVWRGKECEFAFEFERTNKGKSRYFDRLIKFQKSRYSKVVYFCASESIFEVLVQAASAFPKVAVAHSSNPQKVFNQLTGTTTITKFLGV